MTSFELAGSIKEVIFPSMHAVTAEPFRVTPPEAVVYQVSINSYDVRNVRTIMGIVKAMGQ
ncbi:hypothetical protein ACFPCW_24480 [Vibrio thalassae]|uniref:hypothetical protein n=1 Tax=Vibrio thalassae TaxID=1243014 RepID=UPI0013050AF3|nr:hypothetical protein [Vibrio thalassae]